MVPTLFGILLINFAILQFAPGGPVEQIISRINNPHAQQSAGRISGGGGETKGGVSSAARSSYRGSRGLEPALILALNKKFGFDKPAHERFLVMLKNYALFDFGTSFYSDKTVITLIAERMPVSMSLGIPSTLLIFCIAIPLGIKKAVGAGGGFDIASSSFVIVGYAIPAFLFALMLIILFAGGSFWKVFPLSGLVSDSYAGLPLVGRMLDRAWHLVLPVTALSIGGFAILTIFTKNAFLEELGKPYVTTARGKGITENTVLYRHVFTNALIIVIAGLPSMLFTMFFTGSLFIEIIFSLNGLGLLGYEAVLRRDYPVILGTLFIFTLVRLVLNLATDLMYAWLDPRINFESQGG